MGAESPVLDDAAVAAICRHMNTEHRDDSLAIVRAHTALNEAVAAEVTTLDGSGITFRATASDGSRHELTVAWSAPIEERADVRHQLVVLTEAALRATTSASQPIQQTP